MAQLYLIKKRSPYRISVSWMATGRKTYNLRHVAVDLACGRSHLFLSSGNLFRKNLLSLNFHHLQLPIQKKTGRMKRIVCWKSSVIVMEYLLKRISQLIMKTSVLRKWRLILAVLKWRPAQKGRSDIWIEMVFKGKEEKKKKKNKTKGLSREEKLGELIECVRIVWWR